MSTCFPLNENRDSYSLKLAISVYICGLDFCRAVNVPEDFDGVFIYKLKRDYLHSSNSSIFASLGIVKIC